MACRRLTANEFNALPPGAKGYSSESECQCCTNGACCWLTVDGQIPGDYSPVENGWESKCVGNCEYPILNFRAIQWFKKTDCGVGETLVTFTIPGQEPFITNAIERPGICCDDTCIAEQQRVAGWEKLGYGSTEECQAAGVNSAACDAPTCP